MPIIDIEPSASEFVRAAKRLLSRYGGVLIQADKHLRPTNARNIGLQQVDSRYTVFLDNDVMVTDQWLTNLVQCAEDTGAAYVTPVICIGMQTPPVVHVAGGENTLTHEGPRLLFTEHYAHGGRLLSETLQHIRRQRTTMAEFHAVLVRTDVLRELGGLDACCSTAFEHNDFCLSMAGHGGIGWIEPSSVVNYLSDTATKSANLRYHLVRWSRTWINQSLDGFCRKWHLSPDDPRLAIDLVSLHSRRRRPMRYIRGFARRLTGETSVSYVDRVTDWIIDNVICRRLDRKRCNLQVSRWPGACE